MALYQILVFGTGTTKKSTLKESAPKEALDFEDAVRAMFDRAGAWLAVERGIAKE